VINLGEAAERGQVFRRAREDLMELRLRLIQLIQLEEGASEGDAGREVPGMDGEPCTADLDRFLKLVGAPALLGELRKSNRRRIPLDPASKVVNALSVGHLPYGRIVNACVEVARPVPESLTVRVTLYVPTTGYG
jgi:hypothetical protein